MIRLEWKEERWVKVFVRGPRWMLPDPQCAVCGSRTLFHGCQNGLCLTCCSQGCACRVRALLNYSQAARELDG